MPCLHNMSEFIHLKAVPEILKAFGGHRMLHPLVAVVDFSKIDQHIPDGTKVSADFYCILFKHYCRHNVRYGRKAVDFQDGNLLCLSPNQVLEMEEDSTDPQSMIGWGLFFHPDLIRGTALSDKMKDYSFFSYEISESLHLSDKERQVLYECVQKIETELQENIDVHSQAIIVSAVELLLNYCQRFYGRQFITRKSSNNDVVTQVEKFLSEYFKQDNIAELGLPTVKHLAEQVHLSAGYLGDLLKKETGKNAQDHIHFYLIEEAKNVLLSTNKSVGEIAYALGFEYPQYFNKLFKQKTGKTPLEFRGLN